VIENDFSFHSWWRHPHVDGYVVPSDDVAWGLRCQGVAAGRIHVLGVPVMPGFADPPSRTAAADELGIDPEPFTVLLMSGGTGVGRMDSLAATLLGLGGDLRVIALAGAGPRHRDRLERLAAEHPRRLVVLPFTDRVEVPMAAADVVVSKPGGSTVAECLALGAATVLVRPTPGMEDRNAAWLLERGAALLAYDDAGLAVRIDRLRRDPGARARLAAAAHALGRPRAASGALELMLRDQ
jgi:processive 1,2-diacylglycerol beta-glucosyltransferase